MRLGFDRVQSVGALTECGCGQSVRAVTECERVRVHVLAVYDVEQPFGREVAETALYGRDAARRPARDRLVADAARAVRGGERLERQADELHGVLEVRGEHGWTRSSDCNWSSPTQRHRHEEGLLRATVA